MSQKKAATLEGGDDLRNFLEMIRKLHRAPFGEKQSEGPPYPKKISDRRAAIGQLLDRAADEALSRGHLALAERLAGFADEIREGGR